MIVSPLNIDQTYTSEVLSKGQNKGFAISMRQPQTLSENEDKNVLVELTLLL